jgi:hypothetical protein
MAILVLLEFNSDDDAKSFVKEVLEETTVTVHSRYDSNSSDGRHFKPRIRGAWKRPTLFCDCGITKKNIIQPQHRGGFRRGPKYGWWIHAQCGKPTKWWANGDFWRYTLGVNLLPESLGAIEEQGPDARSPAVWNDLLPEVKSDDGGDQPSEGDTAAVL